MNAPPATERDLAALAEGRPPASPALLRYLEVPSPGWSEFLRREYLAGFIAEGGTKLKLLVGTPGTGKSHLLALAAALARDEQYVVAELDAFGTRLFPIDRLYGAIAKSVGLGTLVEAYTRRLVTELGYETALVNGEPFLDQAVRSGLGQEVTLRRLLQERIDALVREPALDPTFAAAVAQAVGHRLGVFHLSAEERDALLRWFHADKVRLGELKTLQIYERADRYSARGYLRSLAAFARLAGYRGLVTCLDNLETVAHRSPETGRQRYTRAQRDEAFETVRQLIDDVDHSRGMLFLLAGRREFLEDEKAGISSYEALRLRLLQEVRADRFNPFADLVDLNTTRQTGYVSPQALCEWMERVRAYLPEGEAAGAPLPTSVSLRDLVLSRAAAPDLAP
jgi:hypothetical protein